MSWSSPDGRPARRAVCAALAAGLLPAIAACGFRPLHYKGEGDEGALADQMAQTRILPMRDRVGQELHNLLRDRLNPAGQPRQPAYVLQISLTESIRELAVQRDETATRADLTLQANYVLRAADSRKVLFTSESITVSSYNIIDQLYATEAAEQGARRRGLRVLAENIRLNLATYFAKPQAPPPSG